MGSSGVTHSVLPSNYHQSISRSAGPPASPSLKRPQMEHLSKSNKKSRLNVREGTSKGGNDNAGMPGTSTSSSKKDKGPTTTTTTTPTYTREMFLTFVDNSLKEKRMGKNEQYNALVSQFKAWSSPSGESSSACPSATLKSYTEALTNVVAQLDRSHSTLVEAVISLPWTTMEEPFVASYMRFVQALLCSRSDFVQMTLEKIVKAFRFLQFQQNAHSSMVEPPNETTRRQTYDRLHRLLSSLIHLIPTLPSVLWPILNRYFPHKRENRNAQVVYITNALKIVEYCPALGENVLGAVILRAIQIDVEIQVDIEDLEDDEGVLDEEVFGYSVENPFERLVGDDDDEDSDSDDDEEGGLDLDAISSDEGSDNDEEEDIVSEGSEDGKPRKVLSPKIIKGLKEMAAKLDAILRVTFEFLQRLNNTPTSTSPPSSITAAARPSSPFGVSSPSKIKNQAEEAIQASLAAHNASTLRKTIFGVLLTVFDEKILRTFQTRHTQFILFWYSSLSVDFTDKFSGNLVGRVLDDVNTPTITRVAAAGYLASFVSRSTNIDRSAARAVMSLLCSYMQDEMEDLRVAHATFGKRLDAERIVKNAVVFYAVCQAAFYIFCFRWKDMLDVDVDGEEQEEEEVGEMEGVPVVPTRRWMSDLEALKEAVSSGLNPLKMCSPTVVSQFARMAHKTDFHYCYSIIEQNKRQSRRSTIISDSQLSTPTAEYPSSILQPSLSRSTSQPSITELNLVQQTLKDAQIDNHFPFDPYKLPLSASYIQGIYRNWDSGLEEDDEDEDTETENEGGVGEDASMQSIEGSSFDSSASAHSAAIPPPPLPAKTRTTTRPLQLADGGMPMKGLIDPVFLHPQDQEDPFSKSFEAMSVSPRRSSWTMAGA